jgi:hypothetical protein
MLSDIARAKQEREERSVAPRCDVGSGDWVVACALTPTEFRSLGKLAAALPPPTGNSAEQHLEAHCEIRRRGARDRIAVPCLEAPRLSGSDGAAWYWE